MSNEKEASNVVGTNENLPTDQVAPSYSQAAGDVPAPQVQQETPATQTQNGNQNYPVGQAAQGPNQYQNPNQAGNTELTNKFFLLVVAWIFPPLAVGIQEGCGWQLFLNIFLTMLLIFPGLIHAIVLIFCMGDRRRSGEVPNGPESV